MELEGVIMRHKGPFFSPTSFLTPTASYPSLPTFLLSVNVSLPFLLPLCLHCHLSSQNFGTLLLEHKSVASREEMCVCECEVCVVPMGWRVNDNDEWRLKLYRWCNSEEQMLALAVLLFLLFYWLWGQQWQSVHPDWNVSTNFGWIATVLFCFFYRSCSLENVQASAWVWHFWGEMSLLTTLVFYLLKGHSVDFTFHIY